jgi:hypothetical protein
VNLRKRRLPGGKMPDSITPEITVDVRTLSMKDVIGSKETIQELKKLWSPSFALGPK